MQHRVQGVSGSRGKLMVDGHRPLQSRSQNQLGPHLPDDSLVKKDIKSSGDIKTSPSVCEGSAGRSINARLLGVCSADFPEQSCFRGPSFREPRKSARYFRVGLRRFQQAVTVCRVLDYETENQNCDTPNSPSRSTHGQDDLGIPAPMGLAFFY